MDTSASLTVSTLRRRRRPHVSSESPAIATTTAPNPTCNRSPSPKKAQAYQQAARRTSTTEALAMYIEDVDKRIGVADFVHGITRREHDTSTHPEKSKDFHVFFPRLVDMRQVDDFLRSYECRLLQINAIFKDEDVFGLLRASNNTGTTALKLCKRLNKAGCMYSSFQALIRAVAAEHAVDVHNQQTIQRYVGDTALLLPPLVLRASAVELLSDLVAATSLQQVLETLDAYNQDSKNYYTDEALVQAVKDAIDTRKPNVGAADQRTGMPRHDHMPGRFIPQSLSQLQTTSVLNPPPQPLKQALAAYFDDTVKRTATHVVHTITEYQYRHLKLYPERSCDSEVYGPRMKQKKSIEDWLRSPDCHLLHIKGDKPSAKFDEELIFNVMRACDNTYSSTIAILKRLNAAGRTGMTLPQLARAVASVHTADVENQQAIHRHIAETKLLLPPLVMRPSVCRSLAEIATNTSLPAVAATLDWLDRSLTRYSSDEALLEAVQNCQLPSV